jgi:hypothetical protein
MRVNPSARAAVVRRLSNAANEICSPVSRRRYKQLASCTASPERRLCRMSSVWASVVSSAVNSTPSGTGTCCDGRFEDRLVNRIEIDRSVSTRFVRDVINHYYRVA